MHRTMRVGFQLTGIPGPPTDPGLIEGILISGPTRAKEFKVRRSQDPANNIVADSSE
jgi:hypothetical protein